MEIEPIEAQGLIHASGTLEDLYDKIPQAFMIDRDHLHLDKIHVGCGHFGTVFRGQWTNGDSVKEVAVKKLNGKFLKKCYAVC